MSKTVTDLLDRRVVQRFNVGGERELRTIRTDSVNVEEREDDDKVRLVGSAIVYNKWTVIAGYFREMIVPGAASKTIKEADVRHLYNHNPDIVLGRTKSKTLRLKDTKKSLDYDVDLNMDDPNAKTVQAVVSRGDVDQSSFAFRIVQEEWTRRDPDKPGDLPSRKILELKLYDTSTVTYPAYEDTEAGLRSAALSILSGTMGLSEDTRWQVIRAIESGELPDDLTKLLEGVAPSSLVVSSGFEPKEQPFSKTETTDILAAEDAPDEETETNSVAEDAPETEPVAEDVLEDAIENTGSDALLAEDDALRHRHNARKFGHILTK